MFTILVVVRKKNMSLKDFRRIWKEEYGPMYKANARSKVLSTISLK